MWHEIGPSGAFGYWIFWIGIAGFVIWLVLNKANKDKHIQHIPYEKPIDVLNKRYANGDISREEYLEKKKDLES